MAILDKKIGILGGGQLGKMLLQAGSKWGLDIHIMDKTRDMPAAPYSTSYTEGDFKNYEDVMTFGKEMDILTIEIESINTEALQKLEESGVKTFPQPHVINLIKDKGLQKQFYFDNDLKSSRFSLVQNPEEVKQKLESGEWQYPFVLKLRKDGYDGRGVMMVRGKDDLDSLFEAPSLMEKLVDIDKEIGVIVVRNTKGEIKVYDAVEMVFDPEANLLDYQIAPADISEKLNDTAKELAITVASKFEIVGLLAVEMFLTKSGELLINEVAPRPHNSGHHSIEACVTSQYEQHLRAILGLPLGSTKLVSNSVLLNLLGEPDKTGEVIYEGFDEAIAIEGVYPHLYGKKITKPKRKMGHINICGTDMDDVKAKAEKVKSLLKATT